MACARPAVGCVQDAPPWALDPKEWCVLGRTLHGSLGHWLLAASALFRARANKPPVADNRMVPGLLAGGKRGSFLLVLLLCAGTYAASSADELRLEFETALAEFDEAQRVQLDQPDRARQLFRSAAQRFDSIIAAGVVNGRLEFNLANCHLQAGDVGRAILHYRRAERLIPGDEILADNLSVARSRRLTTIGLTRRSAFLKSAFFWHYQTSVSGRSRTALVLYVAVWALLILRSFGVSIAVTPTVGSSSTVGPTAIVGATFQSVFPRRALTVAAIVCAVTAAAAGVSVGMTQWSDRNVPEGVVTAMDVVVLKGPGSGYQRRFEQPLQPGVEFALRQRRGEWWKVELPDGKSGWIEAAEAQLIPKDSG